jgi:glycosyltransferase
MYRAVNVKNILPLYVPQTIAFYLEDGLSDNHIYQCLKDELTVKLRYGQNNLFARFIFLLKVIKNSLRIFKSYLK